MPLGSRPRPWPWCLRRRRRSRVSRPRRTSGRQRASRGPRRPQPIVVPSGCSINVRLTIRRRWRRPSSTEARTLETPGASAAGRRPRPPQGERKLRFLAHLRSQDLDHERFRWHVPLAREAVAGSRLEPEARVEGRGTDHDDERASSSAETLDPRLHQPAANPLALPNRHGRHGAQRRTDEIPHCELTEQDMAHDVAVVHGTQRQGAPPWARSVSTMRPSSSRANACRFTARTTSTSPGCSSRSSITLCSPRTAAGATGVG
jgi:hypothetical protein